MSSILNEEKIIQQKLLYKEFWLKKFAGRFADFLFNYDKYNEAESENICKEIFGELENLEFQIYKAEMADYSRKKDNQYHIGLYGKLEKSVTNTHDEIQTLYNELKLRTEQLKNKFEYETLSVNINELEKIETMEHKVRAIQKDIDDLQAKHSEQREKIELKERQLFQLLNAVNEMQDILTIEKQMAMEDEPEKPTSE